MLDLNVWRTLEHKYGHREDTQCPQPRPGWAPDGSLTLKLLNGSRGPARVILFLEVAGHQGMLTAQPGQEPGEQMKPQRTFAS